jgi:uncharacterized protein YndB with AHSA1/START domain
MTRSKIMQPDPKLDLVLERVVDVPAELVWKAWTMPEHLKKWFTPAPWTTSDCEIDLRPGGIFRTVLRSPEGKEFPNNGCYLEVIENERLVWTTALGAGFRPYPVMTSLDQNLALTAVILLEKRGNGTKYTTIAMHSSEETREKHEKMGFHDGWGTALDQLVALMRK